MMRYRFKSNHNVTLEQERDHYQLIAEGKIGNYTYYQSQLNELLRHGIIEPIPKEPRVIKGENRVVSTGIHSYQILPLLPEGTWDIEYTATEIL